MESNIQSNDNNSPETVKKSRFAFTCPNFRSAATWGRFLIALSFLFYGYSHIAYLQYFGSFIPAFLPLPLAWVVLSGVLFMASSILLILDICVKKAATTLLILFTLVTALVFSIEFEPTEVYLYIAILGGLSLLHAQGSQ